MTLTVLVMVRNEARLQLGKWCGQDAGCSSAVDGTQQDRVKKGLETTFGGGGALKRPSSIVQCWVGAVCALSLWNSRFSQWYGRVTAGCAIPSTQPSNMASIDPHPPLQQDPFTPPVQRKERAGGHHAGKYSASITHIAIAGLASSIT